MGGKSRKTGGVSKALINRIKSGGRGKSTTPKCGSTKPKPKSKGLLESPGKDRKDP